MEIIINVTSFNNDRKVTIEDEFRRLVVTKPSTNLNLNTLEQIVITEECGQEILSFQQRYGIEVTGHTSNEFVTAVGKTLTWEEDGKQKQTVILDWRIAPALITEEGRQFASHLIHHELCHVHDNYHRSVIFGKPIPWLKKGDLFSYLHCHADIVWTEYIASVVRPTLLYI